MKKFVDAEKIINSFKQLNPKRKIVLLQKYLSNKADSYYVDNFTGLVFNKFYYSDEEQPRIYSKKVFKKKFTNKTYSSNIPAVAARHSYVYHFIKKNINLKNKTIVDIGAGDGSFLNLFSIKKLLLGIEPKKENCNLIKKKNIKYINQSILKINTNTKFDIATVLWTACNFNNPYESIKKISNLLKVNGHIVLAESSRILVHPKKELKEWVGKMRGYLHPTHYSKNSLINLMKINGFEIKKINRYYDTDYLVIIGQNKKNFSQKYEIDNPEKILNFFKKWQDIDNFLKINKFITLEKNYKNI
jgi:SAM-dependent methyltransferase